MNLKRLFSVANAKKNEKWTHAIINSRSELKEWLMYEKKAYTNEMSFFQGRIICLTEKDFIWKYQRRLRKTEYYLNCGKKIRYIFSRILLIRQAAKYGTNIRLNSCGKGLKIVHLASVITNGDIGENYTAFPNTLVGQTGGKTPVIGNNVEVYTGSTVTGGIEIADGVKIGANSFVNKDISEKNVIVGGVPARILKRK